MMGKREIILNNVSKNIKKKICVLKIDGVDNITFTNKSASIIYNNNIINALEIVDTINNIGINGYFIEDEDVEGNGGSSNDIIRFTFYVNGNYNNSETACDSQVNISPCVEEMASKACGDDYVELGGHEKNETYKNKSCCEMNNKGNKFNVNEDKKFDQNGIEKNDFNLNKYAYNNEANGDSNNNYIDQGSIYKYKDNLETNCDIINKCKNKCNENEGNNINEKIGKNDKDDDNMKKGKKTYDVFNIFRNITKNKKIKSNDNIQPEKKKLLDDTENVYNEDTVNLKGMNHNQAFYEYENYISNNENIYICELRIYNMTCNSCGNKIINFLKNKNLIIDGNSFAIDDKIKLKINIPENMSNYKNDISDGIKNKSNNVKFYVNKIMSEIKDSGFNNDLIDLYKYDNGNDNNLFDITLYIFRDDIIKAYNLFVQIKGVKKVEYDIQNEYIYILYDPDIIGIRCMLELLKKKNNIDAYYDEDKEKYFRSTKNNETQTSRKVIELLCCFFISIIIIILNSYQMSMGNMDNFYAYGNYKNYFKTFKFVRNLNNEHKAFNNNFFEQNNISLSQNIPFSVSHKMDNNYNSNENVDFRKKKKQNDDEEKIKKKEEIASNADLKKNIGEQNLNGEKDNCNHIKNFEDSINVEQNPLDNMKGKHLPDDFMEETFEKKTSKDIDKDNIKTYIKETGNDDQNKDIENVESFKKKEGDDKNKNSENVESYKREKGKTEEVDEEETFLFDFTIDNKSSKNSENNKNLKKNENSKKLKNFYARFMNKIKPKNVDNKMELLRNDKNENNVNLENNSNEENNVNKCKEQKAYSNDKKNCENNEKENKTRIRKDKSCSEKAWLNILLNKLLHIFIDDKNFAGILDKKIFSVLSLRLLLIYILSSIIYLFFGYNFIINGYKNLKNNIINMNVLIFISSSFSYFYSLFLLISCLIFSINIDGIPLYFDTAALLICIIKLGSEIEHFLVQFSKKKMEDLYEKTTKHVNILEERHNSQENNSNLNKKEKTNSSNKLTKKESFTYFGDEKNDGIGKSGSNDIYNCNKNKPSKNFPLKKYLLSNTIDNGKPIDLSKDIDKICLEGKKINLNDYVIKSYPVKFIQKYDLLVFYQGETILVDGIKINDDVTIINESMISGESNGINKYKGDKIYAGSKCAEGICILYISDVTKRNYIEYVKKILDEVNSKKTNLQLYADKIASIFIPFIIILCIVIFLIWFYLTYFGYVNIRNENYFKLNRFLSCVFFSIHFSLSVLCVACPCAVGLASPLSIAISSYICSNIGIIIKNINIFEILLNCNHFIFDKTGTLTVGKPVVNKIFISNNFETFIDQLLKDRPGNNLEIDWEYAKNVKNMCAISNNDEILWNNSNYRDGEIGFFKELTGSKNISDIYNKIEDYEKVENCKNGEYMEVYEMHDNDPSNLLKHCKGKNVKNGKKCLNYLESFNCAGKDVKFYSFSTENDNEYKMRKAIGLKQNRQREGDKKNRDENDMHFNCSGKQTFLNYFMSLINLKKYRQYNNKNINSSNKYDKSFDKSLKEHFINNSVVEFSSDDDSYSSETSSEYNLTGLYNNKNYSKYENHGKYIDSNSDNHYDNNLIDVINNIGSNNMINSSNNW